MGKIPTGLANYLASKKARYGIKSNMPASPMNSPMSQHPMVPMSPSMVSAIKASPKGKIPAGLARWLAKHKKSKKKAKK